MPVDVEYVKPFDPMAHFPETRLAESVIATDVDTESSPDNDESPRSLPDQRAMQLELYASELEWRNKAMTHRQETFEWQLFSSKMVFWMVLTIVATGLWFSGLQLFKTRPPLTAQELQPGASPAHVDPAAIHEFTFKLGPLGVSATSPVLGVIVLVISIVFFFLYLDRVYPIREVGGG